MARLLDGVVAEKSARVDVGEFVSKLPLPLWSWCRRDADGSEPEPFVLPLYRAREDPNQSSCDCLSLLVFGFGRVGMVDLHREARREERTSF
jgi:hypothetical protein